jgi:hypothetical protein
LDQKVAVYEVYFLANPQRQVDSSTRTLTRDVAAIFVTPGIRLRFLPSNRIAPYLAAGAGWANYEQSLTTLAGAPNAAPRHSNRAVLDFGGGVDLALWKFIGLRAEVRDLYAGAPAYKAASIKGAQHNVVMGGGFVLRFR